MLAWLGLMAVVPAHNFYPKKDTAFGQVVVGDGFETVINLTNRGTSEYTGTMILFRLENAAWNPVVNGRTVRDGEYGIRIGPGATVTLRLTGPQLESGAAILLSDDLLLDNLIEANLTYLVLEDGQVSDSVGISPSQEFYRASLPVERFAETGLALANGDTSGEITAEIDLTLFSASGSRLGTAPVTLGPASHRARFLHEFFPAYALAGGRVEIVSDSPIFGTALTLSGGEYSSLPLEPASINYAVRLDSADRFATGELALWAEGSFIRGYLAVSALDGEAFDDPEFGLVQGELEGGRFRLAFTILRDPFRAEEATLSLGHDQFSFGATVVSGEWIELFPDETTLKGTYRRTRRNDGSQRRN